MKRMIDRKELEPKKYYVDALYDGDLDDWLLDAGSNTNGVEPEPFTWAWGKENPPDIIVFVDSVGTEYYVYPSTSYEGVLRYSSLLMYSEDGNPLFIEVVVDLADKSAQPYGCVVQLQTGA